MYKLFEWIIEKKFIFNSDSSLCANFIYKLTSYLQLSQSSSFLRFPYLNSSNNTLQQKTIEPIDYLLKSTKTQKLNIINSQNTDKQNFAQMINDLPPKISCFNINLKSNMKQQDSSSPVHGLKSQTRYSYSIVSMIRFDSDVIGFSTSYGLNSVGKVSESYAHVFSKNLNNQTSYYEIWLNSNGNLLLM